MMTFAVPITYTKRSKPAVRAFQAGNDFTIRDWETGDPIENFEGFCKSGDTWFETWLEDGGEFFGERNWRCCGSAETADFT
jgi:hypothetical protein